MLDWNAKSGAKFCDGVSRRRVLQAGALGSLGLGLPELLAKQAAAAPSHQSGGTFGRAKRVILFFMWGGPAHQDTWDLKPNGPLELRGEFLPISTNVPGIHISEHFPHIARHADKLAIIRSVGQEDNNHSTGAHAGLTGRRHELKAENFAARETDFPHFGSVLSSLRPNHGGMPTFVSLPDVIATTAGKITPGQFAGMLGRKYDPFLISDHPDEPDFSIDTLQLPADINERRMRGRRALMNQVDNVARLADRSTMAEGMTAFYERALDMVLSPSARKAFDIAAVPDEERWRYGWHTFGQSTLMAKRLIESGVQLVTVYWHREVPTIDSSWDTHALNFQELKSRLMPSVDRTIAALLDDLQQSGLLDETLVVWNSEFGRTPKINARAGRDHWGPCNSVVMAGAGIPGGQVFGESDAAAAYPTRDKVTQDDIAATIYHSLGIEAETRVLDRGGRPHHVALGEPIYKLLGGQCQPATIPDPAPIEARPTNSPLQQAMFEYAVRYLCGTLGEPKRQQEWTFTGFAAPAGSKPDRHQRTSQSATLKYTGKFYNHFNYSHAVFRLAEPQSISGVTLKVNGRVVPVSDELANSAAKSVWQVAFPAGLIRSINDFSMTIEGADWPLCDFALCGREIPQMFLERTGCA